MKKIAIIGGGLAGLAAGVFGQKAGYETTIYEKNAKVGGCCYSWSRGEYTIDNCIHWLMGTQKGTNQNDFWRELGGLSDDVEIHKRDAFYSSEYEGKTITLWRDPERTRTEMLELSPEDAQEINSFINCVFMCQNILDGIQGIFDFKEVLKNVTSELPKTEVLKILFHYMKLTLNTWSELFNSELLKRMILDFSAKEYEAFWLIISYAMFTSQNADVPIGGSGQFAERIAKYYESLGGTIKTCAEATEIVFDEEENNLLADTAKVVKFADESFVEADYVICTTSLHHTVETLMKRKHAPVVYKKMENLSKTPVYSSFHCAFSVEGEMEELDDLLYFSCDTFDVGCQIYDRIGVKNYRKYGDYIAPQGQTVIQCSFIQYPEDYKLWTALRHNKEQYNRRKMYTAQAVLERLEERFPAYKGKIHYIDSWTPATYGHYLNSNNGMYMRYITTPLNTDAAISTSIFGLTNVFIAGHSLIYPGGTPMAALTGQLAVNEIVKSEKSLLERLQGKGTAKKKEDN